MGNQSPESKEERRTWFAEAVQAAMSNASTRAPIPDPAKRTPAEAKLTLEQSTEEPSPKPATKHLEFKPINRASLVNVVKQYPIVKEGGVDREQQKTPSSLSRKLHLETEALSLKVVIEQAIEAARHQDSITDGSGSTVIETMFKGSPVKARASSDAVDVAVDWACNVEQKRFNKYREYATAQLRRAEDDYRENERRQNWIVALNFGCGMASAWLLSAMFPSLSLREYAAALLQLWRAVIG
jgi:hypothetical protein